MPRPKLIIMAGPPAAGKSTSAAMVAQALGVPLFSLDEMKERLADAIGEGSLAFVEQIGIAALRQVIATAGELVASGIDVMIEGFIRHGEYEAMLAPLVEQSDAVLIHLRADDLVLKDRYESRALQQDRHWIHGDIARIGTLLPELPPELAAPLELGISRIFIDTSQGLFSIDEIASLVTEVLNTPDTADYVSTSRIRNSGAT